MDICIGASYGSLVSLLSINLENVLSLFGLNSIISLYGAISEYIARSCRLTGKLAKIPAKDNYYLCYGFYRYQSLFLYPLSVELAFKCKNLCCKKL